MIQSLETGPRGGSVDDASRRPLSTAALDGSLRQPSRRSSRDGPSRDDALYGPLKTASRRTLLAVPYFRNMCPSETAPRLIPRRAPMLSSPKSLGGTASPDMHSRRSLEMMPRDSHSRQSLETATLNGASRQSLETAPRDGPSRRFLETVPL